MDQVKPVSKHSLASLIILFAIVNLLVLDVFLVKYFTVEKEKNTTAGKAIAITGKPAIREPEVEPECSSSCQSAINQAVGSIRLTPQPETGKTIIQTIIQPTAVIVQPESSPQNSVKEFFIPLGSGSSNATGWTDIIGTKTVINGNNYSSIKQVLFEATVRVPDSNQIVEVRLYNETDSYVVNNSDFIYPSGTSENFRIGAIQLGAGSKTYKVQMKTQLGYTAVLDQARIHITTN